MCSDSAQFWRHQFEYVLSRNLPSFLQKYFSEICVYEGCALRKRCYAKGGDYQMGKWGFFIVEAKVGMGVQKRCQEFAKGRE